ncbi:hypothetical protein SODALDRAFT_326665 [Sodiomyces alkalinus F11]|uniref:TORC1 subunit TCO89 domain-containing protein n=1 Tax=Sodiomyces alkalinus (strain CBS 110278 / VKM F-3762 / F11) TaxID=1314773 RepID=A0A3N2Q740_SODAK|nr:hypothetical protein SODALDRAFT_326665 [Sodiomyces alkalinus F11]ROT42507.1 hypothetical protein SODALDRAFT_326665 [Sodiomyces alkalinus F11]
MANDEINPNGNGASLTTVSTSTSAPSTNANTATPNQSKRPGLNHRSSDKSHTSDQARENNNTTASQNQQHYQLPHHRTKHHTQKHVVSTGRLHGRVPSAKALYKQHGSNASRLNHRRNASPSPERYTAHDGPTQPHGHRRVQSEAKLSRDSSSANLRRNKSQVEVQKRPKSADKFKRSLSNPNLPEPEPEPEPEHKVKTSAKSQVHFDLGTDDQDEDEDEDEDDEWVDASASASPYLSRRGSMASGQSSAKPGGSASNSRPQTPGDARDDEAARTIRGEHRHRRGSQGTAISQSSPPSSTTTVDRETAQRREYLTTRLLQRTPSQGAPPMMTADTASVSQNRTPDPSRPRSALTHAGFNGFNDGLAATGSSEGCELTSHFVGASSSGGRTQDGPLYRTSDVSRPNSRRSDDTTRRPASSIYHDDDEGDDGTALAPRKARRAAPPAQESRIQQKLNLQRASSTIEPGQSGGGGMGALGGMGMGMGMGLGRMGIGMGMGMGMGPGGATPFVGVAGPGYDGSTTRDPRVAKQLERTGMEYLSVRRYQNPVLRSLDRIAQMQEATKTQRIPTTTTTTTTTTGRNGVANPPGSAAVNGNKTTMALAPPSRPASRPGTAHSRQVTLGTEPAAALADDRDRDPVTSRAQSIRTLHSVGGGGSSFDGETSTGLSGSSLVGGEDDEGAPAGNDGINAILRSLWDKNADLSASQD